MTVANDNARPMTQEVREALDYLKSGGLGEVIGLAYASKKMGAPKVQMDTDMALALCFLADVGTGRLDNLLSK